MKIIKLPNWRERQRRHRKLNRLAKEYGLDYMHSHAMEILPKHEWLVEIKRLKNGGFAEIKRLSEETYKNKLKKSGN